MSRPILTLHGLVEQRPEHPQAPLGNRPLTSEEVAQRLRVPAPKPPGHKNRGTAKVSGEEAAALLWWRLLPWQQRKKIGAMVLRIASGMPAEEAARYYAREPWQSEAEGAA